VFFAVGVFVRQTCGYSAGETRTHERLMEEKSWDVQVESGRIKKDTVLALQRESS
jgi:hypothetical protein